MEEQYPRAWHYHSPPAHDIQAHRSPASRKEGIEGTVPTRRDPVSGPHILKAAARPQGPEPKAKGCRDTVVGSLGQYHPRTAAGVGRMWAACSHRVTAPHRLP